MTDHADLSRRLALAIGHPKSCVRAFVGHMFAFDNNALAQARPIRPRDQCPPLWPWRRFDYRDWSVIGPIAERYNCFPFRVSSDHWHVLSPFTGRMIEADTAAEAVARAVIGAHE